jgi:hypothetical protein
MGEVYEGWDRERQSKVAIKTLPDLDPEKLLGLKREFRSVAALSHPNLLAIHELVFQDERWLLVMEFVDGVDWMSWVRPDDTCSFERLQQTTTQIVQGVRALHDAGILHRDLKPSNVIVCANGDVRVLDFGLAAPLQSHRFEPEARDDISGTLSYMSPEHATPGALAQASDWYALGVMLYEAISGRLPFAGNTYRVLAERLNRDAESLATVAPHAPPELVDLCEGLLRRDPARRLSGGDVLRAFDDSMPAEHADAVARRVFVGRRDELRLLHDAFAGEGPRFASVHGRSGMGKSALVLQFLDEIAGKALVLTGRCYEQESIPFKAFDSVLDSLARHLAELGDAGTLELSSPEVGAAAQIFPVLRQIPSFDDAYGAGLSGIDAQEVRRRAFAGLRQLLTQLSLPSRVVIYIDDLQWGDLDSAALLRELVRPPNAPPFLLVGAWREGMERNSAFLGALRGELFESRHLHIVDVAVGPLSTRDAKALAAILTPDWRDPARIDAALSESNGSPYFLRELIAGADSIVAAPGAALTLDDVIRARVSRLPREARTLLEVVALAGRSLHQRDAHDAAGIPLSDRKPLALLQASNLVQLTADEVEPYHDRVRETVASGLDATSRSTHHARLADALRRSSASVDAEMLAGHLAASDQTAEAAHQYGIAAERAASALAFDRAVDLFTKALQLTAAQGAERGRLTARLAESLANAGRSADAGHAYQTAAGLLGGEDADALTRKAAFQFISAGLGAEGRDVLATLLAAKGMPIPSPWSMLPRTLLAELRFKRRRMRYTLRRESAVPAALLERADLLYDAVRCLIQYETPSAVYYIAKGALAALDTGEPHRIARAIGFKAQAQLGFKPTYSEQSAQLLLKTLDDLRVHDDSPYLRAMVAWAEGYAAFFKGGYQIIVDRMRYADRLLVEQCTGATWEHVVSATYVAIALSHLGRVSELNTMLEPLLREARERQNRNLILSLSSHPWALGELGVDRPESALAIIDELWNAWPQYTLQRAGSAHMRSCVLLYTGRSAEAWKSINGEWRHLRGQGYLLIHQLWQWAAFARAQSALALAVERPRDRGLLRQAKRDAAWLASDRVFGGSQGLAAIIRAGLAARMSRDEEAVAELAYATEVCDAFDLAAIGGAARRRQGELIGGDSGRSIVAQADRRMQEVGIVNPERMTRAFTNGF